MSTRETQTVAMSIATIVSIVFGVFVVAIFAALLVVNFWLPEIDSSKFASAEHTHREIPGHTHSGYATEEHTHDEKYLSAVPDEVVNETELESELETLRQEIAALKLELEQLQLESAPTPSATDWLKR